MGRPMGGTRWPAVEDQAYGVRARRQRPANVLALRRSARRPSRHRGPGAGGTGRGLGPHPSDWYPVERLTVAARQLPRLPRFSFAEVTTLTERRPGEFRADVNGEWTIRGKPNGGYLLAMMGRAAVSVSRHQHVIAASAQYLRSPNPGPV